MMGIRYCGIDASLLHTGIVILEDVGTKNPVVVWEREIQPTTQGFMRCLEVSEEIQSTLEAANGLGLYVALEGYAFGATGHLPQLGEMGGMIKYRCHQVTGEFPLVIPPTSNKAFIGEREKSKIIRQVHTKWGFYAMSDNTADAYGLARFLMAYHGAVVPLAYEAKAVEAVKNPKAKSRKKRNVE